MTSAAPPAPRVIDALTGVRALAAFAVLAYHLRTPLLVLLPPVAYVDTWLSFGYLGVDVFFVLSGFVISHNYAERLALPSWTSRRDFLVARLARLYPVHLVTLLLAAGLVFLAGHGVDDLGQVSVGDHTAAGFVGNLVLLQGLPGVGMWNGPSWSISCEAGAYLAFPFVAWLLVRCGRVRGLLGAATAAVVLIGATTYMSAVTPFPFFSFLWVRLVTEFAMGCFLWAAWRRTPGRRRGGGDVLAVVALVGAAGFLSIGQRYGLVWFAVPCLAVAIAAVASATGPVRAVLAWRPVERCGRISYSLYLAHGLVLAVAYTLLPYREYGNESIAFRISVVAVYVVVPVLVSALLYHLVEEPARVWIRRRATGARPAAPPAPAAERETVSARPP